MADETEVFPRLYAYYKDAALLYWLHLQSSYPNLTIHAVLIYSFFRLNL